MLSMDDFGTGYSSLSCLNEIPIDILKLDRSFLQDIEDSYRSQNIVKFIIWLAHSLNILVVMEGVETQSQVSMLKSFGCNVVQGFYFGKPMKKQDYYKLL